MCGWPSAALPILQDAKATPLETGPLSMEQASWVSSLMCAGGFFGNWFFAFCCERFGRKMPLIGCAVVMFAGWLLISLANSPDYLYAGRFLGGFSGGGIFVLVPMFVTEIAADHVRGALGSLLVFAGNLGFLVAFVLGNYLTYAMSPIVLLACPVLFVACFAFMPESPVYLVQCGRHADAAKALSFYRNACASESVVSMELDKLKAMFEKPKTANDSDASEATSIEWSFFCTPLARRAMLIGLGLVTLSQFNGCFAMMMYTATIFREAGTDIAPNMAAIVIGVIQVGGAYFSTVMVDRAGRKFLMVFSALGTACGLVSLGVHAHLKELGVDMSAWGWLPVASFSLAIFVASAGMLSLPFLIVAEIMPEKVNRIYCRCGV